MNSKGYQHKIVLLTTPFQYPHRRLLFPRARLYPDRIALTGWAPGELHKAEISLAQLCRAEWFPGASNGPNAVFHIQDGTQIPLFLKQIHHWEHRLEALLRWRVPLNHLAQNHQLQNLRDLVAYTTSMS